VEGIGSSDSAVGLQVSEHRIEFQDPRETLEILLAQISPAFDPEILRNESLIRCRSPEKQFQKILKIITYAVQNNINLVVFPELSVPFSYLPLLEDTVRGLEKELVINFCYEHVPLKELVPLLSPRERKEQGLAEGEDDPRMANFCRILIKTARNLHIFTQLKLTPFSGEFSLSARETLFCGRVLHKFITNWGNFLFLICKDYVGEIRGARQIPMFDFLKTLTEGGLHYIFVSAMNPEPEAFVHAARAFYYLQEKSSATFTVLLNTAELGHTAIIFPVRPHPGVRPAAGMQLAPLFEGKPGWGTQLRFPEKGERLISGTLVRLDRYKPMPTKQIFSPVYEVTQLDISALGIEPDTAIQAPVERAPPAKPRKPLSNLPVSATPFVGRERELAEIEELLSNPSCRLVTLVGPGGMGKTRLAVEAASRKMGDFAHGTFFVALEPLRSTEDIVPVVAESIGFSFYQGGDPKGQLLDYLREKEMLLVLDNFEHLMEGADLVAEILHTAPTVKLIVTSRERLNLQGEWLVEVGGLSEDSARTLFLQSARRVCPDFVPAEDEAEEIEHICALVEWMPLAIELAASWLRVLTLAEIAEEIQNSIDFLSTSFRDVPGRHRSLRAVFDHSWELLSEEERRAFRRLSVFRGGFTRKAAAEVAGVSLPVLSALVDKSLLFRGEGGRYDLHELLRGYGRERLREDPDEETEVLKRHCDFFASFARRQAERLEGNEQEIALRELRGEFQNLKLAWENALKTLQEEAIGDLMEGLYRFYEIQGRFQEGAQAFADAVALLKKRGKRGLLLAKALARQGRFRHALGSSKEAEKLLEEALALARETGDARETALISRLLGEVKAFLGDYRTAVELVRESLDLSRGIGDRPDSARALNTLGTVAWNMGEFHEAKRLYQESLSIERELGDERGMAITLNNLGIIHGILGELEEARALFTESLAISEKLGDLPSMARCLNNLGVVATKLGELEKAREFHERGLEIERETGNRGGAAGSLSNLGNLAFQMGNYGEAKGLYLRSLMERQAIGDSIGEIISLMNLCEVCFAVGEDEEGARYLREALAKALEIDALRLVVGCLAKMAGYLLHQGEKLRAGELLGLVLGHPALDIDGKEDAEDVLSRLRTSLSPEELERALKRGSGMDPKQVAKELLDEP